MKYSGSIGRPFFQIKRNADGSFNIGIQEDVGKSRRIYGPLSIGAKLDFNLGIKISKK